MTGINDLNFKDYERFAISQKIIGHAGKYAKFRPNAYGQ
jgi:hypothetical protein